MAFSEFCNDLSREEVPVPFVGGNNKQRDHLNKLVKFAQAVLDSAKRRGGEDDGGVAGGSINVWLNNAGEAGYYRLSGEQMTPP